MKPAFAFLGLWLLAGCDRGDPLPEDGGIPIEFGLSENEAASLSDPCRRREKGGWHYSVGHCQAMTGSRRMKGVWVTAFEEGSFFPDETAKPAADDPRRYGHEIEFDREKAERRSGHVAADPNGEAYFLTFVGRRTLDPWFDCQGRASFVFVVDRLLEVRYLGPVSPLHRVWKTWRPPAEPRYAGRWGRMQARAIGECRKRSR